MSKLDLIKAPLKFYQNQIALKVWPFRPGAMSLLISHLDHENVLGMRKKLSWIYKSVFLVYYSKLLKPKNLFIFWGDEIFSHFSLGDEFLKIEAKRIEKILGGCEITLNWVKIINNVFIKFLSPLYLNQSSPKPSGT